MGLSVNFKTQRGVITNRRFNPGEGISLYGTAKTLLGLPMANAQIKIDIVDKNGITKFYKETFTDFWSDYNTWFQAPISDESLTVKIWALYPDGGQDFIEVPIAIGNGSLKPVPNPEMEFSILSYLPLLVIGLGTIYFIKVLNE